MANARYFLPDHPTFTDVYSKNDLRAMLVSGKLSRSDVVLDDETGLGHLLGDLLAMPYRDVTNMPLRSTSGTTPRPQLPPNHEFRADTPLPRPESEFRPPSARRAAREEDLPEEDEDEDEDEDDAVFDEEDLPEEDEDEDEDDAVFDEEDLDAIREEDEEEAVDEDALLLERPAPGLREEEGGQEHLREEVYRPGQRPAPEEEEAQRSEDREPEEMLYQCHPSWFAYPRSLIGFLLAITAAFVSHRMQFGMEWILLFGSVAGLVLLFVGLDRYTCTYFITTRRVEMEYGVIGRNTREVRIRDIRAIDVQQRGWRALLGLGTLKFDSSVSSGPEVYFRNVRRPHDIKELVRELQR